VNRLDVAPFELRLQGHDAVSGKVIASLCKDVASDVFGPNQLSYFIIYMKESKTFVSKAIMEDEIKLRQLERSLKLRVKTGCDTCR
jgi:hypothetical protein